MEQRHFHKRNLPHLYYNGGEYFITYRLADSIPLKLTLRLHEQYKLSKDDPTFKEKKIFKKYDELLDRNENEIKYLLDERIAGINRDKLIRWIIQFTN